MRPPTHLNKVMAFIAPIPTLHSSVGKQEAVKSPRRKILHQPTISVLDKPGSNAHMKQISGEIVRDFLTRRAVRTVLYYFQEMRDSASTNWLQNFENFEMKDENDVFEDGDSFLTRMQQQAQQQGEYVQQHTQRAYLTKRYRFTIRPAQIAQSILASRKQLAAEWAIDLQSVEAENLEMQRMSFERLVEQDARILNSRRNQVFDVDSGGFDQTPLRSNNLQKLLVLVTQHAITRHMVYLRDNSSSQDYIFLYNFTAQFGALNNGTEYLEKLMLMPQQKLSHNTTNSRHIVNPRILAMSILRLREVIAKEWISIMNQIPEEQHELTISMLRRSANLEYPFSEDEKESQDK